MSVSVITVAEKVESMVHNAFSLKGDDFGFNLPQAMMVGVSFGENGQVTDVCPELSSHEDIYSLIDSATPEMLNGFNGVAIVTCGWAAPLNNGEMEGMPSEHPQRRRVRLLAFATRQEIASVLRFQDDAENVITDAGEASGPLADAVSELATLLGNL